jgi:hypothetical protein
MSSYQFSITVTADVDANAGELLQAILYRLGDLAANETLLRCCCRPGEIEALAERVRTLRTQQGLSVAELAARLGWSDPDDPRLLYIEDGRYWPTAQERAAINSALKGKNYG